MLRVFIATTEGPVEILSIRKERENTPSVICISGTIDKLSISKDYKSFVDPGVGVIANLTGWPAYRVDVDKRIDSGWSWQLPIAIAHLLEKNGLLANKTDVIETIVIATGHVKSDYSVGSIDHVDLKYEQMKPLVSKLRAQDKNVVLIVPKGQAPSLKLLPLFSSIIEVSHLDDLKELDASFDTLGRAREEVQEGATPSVIERNVKVNKMTLKTPRAPLRTKWGSAGIAIIGIVVLGLGLSLMNNFSNWSSLRDQEKYHKLKVSLKDAALPFSAYLYRKIYNLPKVLDVSEPAVEVIVYEIEDKAGCKGSRFRKTNLIPRYTKVDDQGSVSTKYSNNNCDFGYKFTNNEDYPVHLAAIIVPEQSSSRFKIGSTMTSILLQPGEAHEISPVVWSPKVKTWKILFSAFDPENRVAAKNLDQIQGTNKTGNYVEKFYQLSKEYGFQVTKFEHSIQH